VSSEVLTVPFSIAAILSLRIVSGRQGNSVTDETGLAQSPALEALRGVQSLGLERRPRRRNRSTRVFDWIALVLAFLAPPVGILASVVALVVG